MEIGTFLGFLIVAFVVSTLIAHWLVDRRKSGSSKAPDPGTTLRLRATAGVYRSKLILAEAGGWRISAPLSRNHYVPLRIGESITVEAPVQGGVYLFKTIVAARDADLHELILCPPTNVAPTERRTIQRCERVEPITIEGEPGQLVDISALGARLKTRKRFTPGDRVRLDLRDGLLFAWVLESWPTRHGDDWRENLRVRFEASVENVCP